MTYIELIKGLKHSKSAVVVDHSTKRTNDTCCKGCGCNLEFHAEVMAINAMPIWQLVGCRNCGQTTRVDH